MIETHGFQPDEIRRSDCKSLVHHHVDWGMVRADIVVRTGLRRQETCITPERHSFLLNLKGETTAGEDFVEGRRVAFAPRRPGSVIFLPARSEWRGWDEGAETGSYLLVSVDPKFIRQTLGADEAIELKPVIGFRDSTIETSLQMIASELKTQDPISIIMVESQAVQSLVQLVRLNGYTRKAVKGGLSPFDLKRITSVMEARLTHPPSLDELAAEVGISRRHFSRAFKKATGRTPYAYVADYRLRRAVDLLRATDLSATDIALECGYSSSSHFTFAFKRATGAGPLEFRRTWRR